MLIKFVPLTSTDSRSHGDRQWLGRKPKVEYGGHVAIWREDSDVTRGASGFSCSANSDMEQKVQSQRKKGKEVSGLDSQRNDGCFGKTQIGNRSLHPHFTGTWSWVEVYTARASTSESPPIPLLNSFNALDPQNTCTTGPLNPRLGLAVGAEIKKPSNLTGQVFLTKPVFNFASSIKPDSVGTESFKAKRA